MKNFQRLRTIEQCDKRCNINGDVKSEKVQNLNKEKGAKRICKSEKWKICKTVDLHPTEGGFNPENPVYPV
jgi:hypothetical protein